MKRYGALPFVDICEREALNPNDCYAVAVKKDDVVINHLSRALSRICSLFIARGGAITYVVAKWSTKIFYGSFSRRIRNAQ